MSAVKSNKKLNASKRKAMGSGLIADYFAPKSTPIEEAETDMITLAKEEYTEIKAEEEEEEEELKVHKKHKASKIEQPEEEPQNLRTSIDHESSSSEPSHTSLMDADVQGDQPNSTDATILITRLGKHDYHPIKDAIWKAGRPVPYAALAAMFEAISSESGRLITIAKVSDLFRSILALTPKDLLPCVYLCCNTVAPAYEGKEIGVGDSLLIKALAEATGSTPAKLKTLITEAGDLGEVASKSRNKQGTLMQSSKLSIREVFATLKDISESSGNKVQAKKVGLIKRMMVTCNSIEAKFLVRCLQGKLRIGLAEKGVIAALGRALVLTPPVLPSEDSSKQVLDCRQTIGEKKFNALLEETAGCLGNAYTEVPNHERIINSILQYGVKELPNRCFLTPGIPVKVMLGRPATSVQEILERFTNALFTLEYKYDGERAQVHLLKNGTIKIYSRNSEDHSGKYPDILARLPNVYKGNNVQDFIIDCECVAWDRKEKKLMPFQTLSTRKRKDVVDSEITVQVLLFGFDLLYLNGKSYLNECFKVRRETLWKHFNAVEGEFAFAAYRDTNDVEDIQNFLQEAIDNSCEGLMVKALVDDATYIPDKRNWLKVKKDYLEGVGDTLDLVPIGAWYGKGKRTGVFGSFLLACYNPEEEEFECITKVGTGFSDEALEKFSSFYNSTENDSNESRVLKTCPRYVRIADTLKPDVFLAPVAVWEVKCADISISPVHLAALGKVHESKGLALRFPRFMRVRDDKKAEDATNSDQIVQMYENQSVIKENSKKKHKPNNRDDDY